MVVIHNKRPDDCVDPEIYIRLSPKENRINLTGEPTSTLI